MHMQNLVKIHLFVLKILGGNRILTFKGRKWMLNNPKLDVVNTNACAKFCQNPNIYTQDIEWKRNSDIIQVPELCTELTKMDV